MLVSKYNFESRKALAWMFQALVSVFLHALYPGVSLAQTDGYEDLPARKWIQEMKSSERGPFSGIRWFCNDGSIRPARAGCSRHGGGIQHGQWSKKTEELRDAGYRIANVYAAIDELEITEFQSKPRTLTPLLVERYLITRDDGWIYRNARGYRGAAQIEDEIEGAKELLLSILSKAQWRDQHYFLAREAARLFPRAAATELLSTIRNTASNLAKSDRRFTSIRNKIHAYPDAEDSNRIRSYAIGNVSQDKRVSYFQLANLIDTAYSKSGITDVLRNLAANSPASQRKELLKSVQRLIAIRSIERRYLEYASILETLREHIVESVDSNHALQALDASIQLEQSLYVAGRKLATRFSNNSRSRNLDWLEASIQAIYGAGLLNKREYYAARRAVLALKQDGQTADSYYRELSYLELLPSWAADRFDWYFGPTIQNFEKLEPLVPYYIPDRVRASPLFLYSQHLDFLLRDAVAEIGTTHRFFSKELSRGLRVLNPGIARGRLFDEAILLNRDIDHSKTIVLVPETIAQLPAVAGLLTMKAGNAVSHVQLLARNLGIPNVVVSEELLDSLSTKIGSNVVLAVSPGGRVELALDGPQWEKIFTPTPIKKGKNISNGSEKEGEHEAILLSVDSKKLDLSERRILPLNQLSGKDSGVIVGPKAAHLAELQRQFPGTVSSAIVLPFGVYASFLELPLGPEGKTLQNWITSEYAAIHSNALSMKQQQSRADSFLRNLRRIIRSAKFNPLFLDELRKAVETHIGPIDQGGVFVRSDTNVEDLPQFSGAGLNKTVANVIRFEDLARAILEVWASPFSWRAYSWRQAHMKNPIEVYVSVLIQRTVPVEKSGVLVTVDVQNGDPTYLTIASNWGIGGVVSNQAAEVVTVNRVNGNVRLLSSATAQFKKTLSRSGGLVKSPVNVNDTTRVLSEKELLALHEIAAKLPHRFPQLVNSEGKTTPADVEFGFINQKLILFQIRPYLENSNARRNRYLLHMDERTIHKQDSRVWLSRKPGANN